MKLILKPILLTGLILSFSCKNDKAAEQSESGDSLSPETEVSDLDTGTESPKSLVINAKNLLDIENAFKVDFYETARKYGGKQATVTVAFQPAKPYSQQEPIFYGDKQKFNGFPLVTDTKMRISLDGDTKEVRQTYVQLANGDISAIYGPEYLGPNDEYYLIYDKRLDVVLTGYNHVVDLIAGYIRMKNNGGTKEYIDDLFTRIEQEDPTLLKDIKDGNLYYVEYKDNGKTDQSAFLLPCEYTFTGTISKDIQERTSNYGISKIDLQLIGAKQVSKKWLIDPKKIFTKQIK